MNFTGQLTGLGTGGLSAGQAQVSGRRAIFQLITTANTFWDLRAGRLENDPAADAELWRALGTLPSMVEQVRLV